jgi:hypothetical protein
MGGEADISIGVVAGHRNERQDRRQINARADAQGE